MSIAAFAEGLSRGIPTGVELGEGIVRGQNRRGVREANEIFAQIQSYQPGVVNNEAIPVSGQTTEAPNYQTLKTQYMQALRNVSDFETLNAMQDRLAALEKDKVLEQGTLAVAALQAGDSGKAQRHFQNMTSFLDPENAPQVFVDKNGTTIVDYGNGEGMALNADQVLDMMHMFTDLNNYRSLAFNEQRHADDMALRERQLAAEIFSQTRRDDAYVADAQSRIADREAQIELSQARIEQIEQEVTRANALYKSGLEAAEQERFDEMTGEAFGAFEGFYTMPGAFENAGGGVPEVDPALVDPDLVPPPSESQLATSALQQQASESLAWAQEQQAFYLQQLNSDPLYRQFAYTAISGLIAANPNMPPEQAAAIAFSALHDPNDRVQFDAQSGAFNSAGHLYDVGETFVPALASLMGTMTGQQVEQAPAPPDSPRPPTTAIPSAGMS